ncbi:MAG TPA: hypothetical protein VGC77_18220 [Rhodopseudomonas sp.]|uniref:nSTAND1 domain-containing NTPase n=1 Tax=Rhodopseudomonas sp. TaxID=1078 RepID=UPI002ED8D16A
MTTLLSAISQGRAFASFVELQQANLELLEDKVDSTDGNGSGGHLDKVVEFIGKAVVTGKILQRPSERKAAQAAIEYWTTSLILSREYSSGAASEALSSADPAAPTVAVLADFDPRTNRSLSRDRSPYKGLDPFTRGDADDYFGREDAAEELLNRIEGPRPVVLLLGPSGSGKSSLINAGLLPRLEDKGHKVVVVASPGREPLAAILRAIRPGADLAAIRSEERAIVKTPGKLNDALTAFDPQAILIIDQFGEALARADVQPSLDVIGRALASLAGSHKLLVCLRESQRLQFEKIAGIGDAAHSPASLFSPPPPSIYELRSMIEGPAEQVGLRFGVGVVDDLVRSVAGNPDALPLLQFTLNKLWDYKDRDEITQAVYREVGSPREALTSTAETVLQQFSDPKKDLARRIFLKLVVPAGDKDFVRNRVGRDTLALGEDAAAVGEILDAFERARLLRRLSSADIDGEDRFEVAHETLIGYWPTLASWLADARHGRETESKLISTARLWLDSGRDEGYLITGDALEPFKDYRSDSMDVRQLLEASFKARADHEVELQKKQRYDRGVRIGAIVSAFVIIAAFGLAQYYQKQQEDRKIEEGLRAEVQKLTDRLEELQRTAAEGKSVDFKASLASTISDSAAQTVMPQPTPQRLSAAGNILADSQPALPQPQFDPKTGDCFGYMWVGSKTNWKLKSPDSPDKLRPGPAVTNASIYLRADFPTELPEYAMAVPFGFVPEGTAVTVQQTKAYQRETGLQYWAKVSAPRKSCAKVNIQYAGSDDLANQLRKNLTASDFQVTYAPEKIAGAAGLSEIRFFFKEDTDLAEAVAAKVREINGGRPVSLRPLLSFVGSKPLVPGSLEVWVDLSPVLPSKQPATATNK